MNLVSMMQEEFDTGGCGVMSRFRSLDYRTSANPNKHNIRQSDKGSHNREW